MQNDKGYIIAY